MNRARQRAQTEACGRIAQLHTLQYGLRHGDGVEVLESQVDIRQRNGRVAEDHTLATWIHEIGHGRDRSASHTLDSMERQGRCLGRRLDGFCIAILQREFHQVIGGCYPYTQQ